MNRFEERDTILTTAAFRYLSSVTIEIPPVGGRGQAVKVSGDVLYQHITKHVQGVLKQIALINSLFEKSATEVFDSGFEMRKILVFRQEHVSTMDTLYTTFHGVIRGCTDTAIQAELQNKEDIWQPNLALYTAKEDTIMNMIRKMEAGGRVPAIDYRGWFKAPILPAMPEFASK
ncbi:hypothetical protein B0A50_07680 [Salinomyces thailandicus]|uniref:Uncharacterized protein n=1 Tax=Salinomyces thailandicus TaxID=706561 RepID=A0A4U0TLU4_9PEZI|nr:hypothetical protein B0A50_07680 [Salinomyces thailandica]